jgi:hypothetical protein
MPGQPPNPDELPSAHPEWVKNEYKRIGRERLESEREMSRLLRWELIRSCIECMAGAVIGAVLMGEGMHVTDPETGGIFFIGGMVVGYTLITVALARAYARWRKYNG